MMGIRRRERAPLNRGGGSARRHLQLRRGRPEVLVTVQRTPIQLGNRRW